jgi:hypothetical protein
VGSEQKQRKEQEEKEDKKYNEEVKRRKIKMQTSGL